LIDFYAMTWNEWCFYSSGIEKNKVKEWEHTRQICWMLYKANSDPKKSDKVMTEWWKLPTDAGYVERKQKVKRARGKRLTAQQVADFFNAMR